jgi:hypothetical protein
MGAELAAGSNPRRSRTSHGLVDIGIRSRLNGKEVGRENRGGPSFAPDGFFGIRWTPSRRWHYSLSTPRTGRPPSEAQVQIWPQLSEFRARIGRQTSSTVIWWASDRERLE